MECMVVMELMGRDLVGGGWGDSDLADECTWALIV